MPKKTTQKEAELKVQEVCQEHNFTYKPFVYKNVRMKIHLTCSNGHEFVREYSNFINRKGQCVECVGKQSKPSQEEAIEKVLNICNEHNYSLVGDFIYVNSKSILNLKCNNDGHEWNIKYTSFVNTGYRCAKCNGTAKYNIEELKSKIQEISETKKNKIIKCDLAEKDVLRKSKITVECINGHVKETSVAAYLRGSDCVRCASKKRNNYAPDGIISFVNNLCEEKSYTLISIDDCTKKSQTRITLQCNNDNYQWSTSISHLYNGTECPRCTKTGKLTENEIIENVNKICLEKNFKIINSIPTGGFDISFEVECEDEHIFQTTYTKLVKRGTGCHHCCKTTRISTDEAIKNVLQICEETNFKLVKEFEYTNNMTKIQIQCIEDGYIWDTNYANFTRGKQCCPRCVGLETLTQEEAEANVLSTAYERGYFLYQPYLHNGVSTKIHIECSKDGTQWSPTYETFVRRKNGCPTCAGKEQTFAYINTIQKKHNNTSELIGFKYGVETVLGSRTKRQNSCSIYEISRLTTFVFEHTNNCKAAENECSTIFKNKNMKLFGTHGIIPKDEMSDGFTETTLPEDLNLIREIYIKHGGVEI